MSLAVLITPGNVEGKINYIFADKQTWYFSVSSSLGVILPLIIVGEEGRFWDLTKYELSTTKTEW